MLTDRQIAEGVERELQAREEWDSERRRFVEPGKSPPVEPIEPTEPTEPTDPTPTEAIEPAGNIMTTATAPAPQSNQKTIPEMVEEHLARDRHERSPQGRAEAEFETSRQLYHSMGVTRDAYVARRVPEIVAAGNPDPDPELTEVSVRMADIDYRREYKAQESILSQSFTEASYVEFRRQEKRQTMTATPPQQTSPQPPAVVEAEAPATPLSELTEADFRAEYAAHAADVFAPFGISEEAYITCRKAEQGQRAG